MTYDYRPLSAMIQALPTSKRWTATSRQRWLDALTAIVDLMVDIDPDTQRVPPPRVSIGTTSKPLPIVITDEP